MSGRFEFTDAEWEPLKPLLPADPPRGGRWRDPRTTISGVLFRERTGITWRDLPTRFGPWKTVYQRKRRWALDGTWARICEVLRTGCYSLALIATGRQADIAKVFSRAGLPPDSIRWRYQPLYHQPLFQSYATVCPNAEHLAAATVELPVHPQLVEATVAWIANQTARIAQGEIAA